VSVATHAWTWLRQPAVGWGVHEPQHGVAGRRRIAGCEPPGARLRGLLAGRSYRQDRIPILGGEIMQAGDVPGRRRDLVAAVQGRDRPLAAEATRRAGHQLPGDEERN
jgi:hypothetical protein